MNGLYYDIRCGSKYTLLRDEFYKIKKTQKQKNDKFIVFIGIGVNMNYKVLSFLKQFKGIQIEIITTSLNKNLISLKNLVKQMKNCSLHIDCNYVVKLMYNSDLAIVTPSVIINEVLFLDIDFIAIQIMENQIEMYKFLKENNYFVYKKFYEFKNKLTSIIKEKI